MPFSLYYGFTSIFQYKRQWNTKTIATYGILKCTYFRICCYTLYRFIFLSLPLPVPLALPFPLLLPFLLFISLASTVSFQWSKREPHLYADIFHFIILICANIYGFYFEEQKKNKRTKRNQIEYE